MYIWFIDCKGAEAPRVMNKEKVVCETENCYYYLPNGQSYLWCLNKDNAIHINHNSYEVKTPNIEDAYAKIIEYVEKWREVYSHRWHEGYDEYCKLENIPNHFAYYYGIVIVFPNNLLGFMEKLLGRKGDAFAAHEWKIYLEEKVLRILQCNYDSKVRAIEKCEREIKYYNKVLPEYKQDLEDIKKELDESKDKLSKLLKEKEEKDE